jgi:hypothetical protein
VESHGAQENRTSQEPNAILRRFETLRKKIAPLHDALLSHPIYAEVDSLSRPRELMQIDVFAQFAVDATREFANRPICERSCAGRRKRSGSGW